ncbi:hypothetical protein RHS03_07688, partial [Rhizoctonia solani]
MASRRFNSNADQLQSLPELRSANRLNERIDTTRVVFRVFDSSSFRGYHPANGFEATGFDKTSLSYAHLAEAHVDRDNRNIITPWLSTSRRWLWAVWDMNRRSYLRRAGGLVVRQDSIRVAVIDLNACKGGPFPPVHSLSLLSPNSKLRQFANISDEILIYGHIPPSAIISVWKFEKIERSVDIVGIPRIISQKMPTDGYESYRDVHHNLVTFFKSSSSAIIWQAREEGQRCADIAINMLYHGYDQLDQELEEMLAPIRGTRTWVYEKRVSSGNVDGLIREVNGMSCGGASEPSNLGVHGTNMPQPSKLGGKFVLLKKGAIKFCKTRSKPRQDSGRTKQPTESQQKYYEAPEVKLARHKIEYLRGVALELSRTIPLGLMDELNMRPHDWGIMKMCMMESINAWLAPLERSLEGLEDMAVPGLISNAKNGWLEAESDYPKWWEIWGSPSMIGSRERPSNKRYYTY